MSDVSSVRQVLLAIKGEEKEKNGGGKTREGGGG